MSEAFSYDIYVVSSIAAHHNTSFQRANVGVATAQASCRPRVPEFARLTLNPQP